MKKFIASIADSLKKFKFKSMFIRTFLQVFVLMFIPTIIAVCIFVSMYRQNIKSEFENKNRETSVMISNLLDNIFLRANTNLTMLMSNANAQMLFEMSSENIKAQKILEFNNKLNDLKVSFALNDENFLSFIIYPAKGNYLYYNSISKKTEFDKSNHNFFDMLKNCNAITLLNNRLSDEHVITIMVPIWPYVNKEGVYAYNISYDSVKNYISDSMTIKDFSAIEILFNDSVIFTAANSEENPKNSRSYLSQSGIYNITYRYTVSEDNHLKKIHKFYLITIAALTVIFVFAILLSALISSKSYMPISKLLELSDSPLLWADNQSISHKLPQNEIEYIITNIWKNVSTFSNEATARSLMLKKAHATALQSQLTPHFLYNTLLSINLTIMEECGFECSSSNMVVALSEFLKYSYKINDIIIPLENELFLAKKYVELMRFRYGDIITLEIAENEDLNNVKITKLSLQPILENAIYHGIVPAEKNCIITIKPYAEGEKAVISVSNNGVPIPPHDLQNIRQNLRESPNITDEHLGIINVDSRIKLAFGIQYGLRVYSDSEKTEFRIYLPYK